MSFTEYAENDMRHELRETFQTKVRGSDDDEYQIYLACADDGDGFDITTGYKLKTYDEWLES